MDAGPTTGRGALHGTLVGLAVFAVSMFTQVTGGFAPTDEAWFVQVVRRVVDGDVLYRDVAFGINPLSVYISAAAASVFGAEVLVTKTIQSVVFTGAVLVSLGIIRRLGLRSVWAELTLVAAFFAWAPAAATLSLYTPLSMLFVLCALNETLRWVDGDCSATRDRVVRAGLLVGAAFAAKQNVGALAFAALAVVILVVRPAAAESSTGAVLKDLGRASVAAAAVVAIALIPVVASGAFGGFLAYGYLGKTLYLQTAGVNPLVTLGDWAAYLRTSSSPARLRGFLTLQGAILPIVAFGGLAVLAPAWWRADRRHAIVVLTFAAAAYVAVFPRADMSHLAGAVPVLLVACAQVAVVAQPRVPRGVSLGAGAVACAFALGGTAVRVGGGLAHLLSPEYAMSNLPGLRGVLMPVRSLDEIETERACLDRLFGDGDPVFLVSARAGMISLIGRRTNPTPYDYPFVTTLGPAGEDALIEALESGRIRRVCVELEGRRGGALWPARFEADVARRLPLAGETCGWALYGPPP